jgi:glyoxylase-like metal-dependent hydrolase (beta-lactamase superfamily II)
MTILVFGVGVVVGVNRTKCTILQHSVIVFAGLGQYGVQCSDIHYVVCTHGHSDHIGNNNLFLNAKHIVGFSISCKDLYVIHPFETGEIK